MTETPITSRDVSGPPDTPHSGFSLDRADWLSITVLVAFALVARLTFAFALPPLLHLDSDSYFEITERLWRGEGFGDLSRRTPLYPIFLWAAARFEGVGLLPVILVQHLFGVATVVLGYLFARRLLPAQMRTVAVISGLVLAVVPYPILAEHSVLSEPLFTFLLMASAHSLMAWRQEGRVGCAAWCGAMLALASLTRPIAAGIFPLWVLLLLLQRKSERRRALEFLLYAGAVWAALLAPLLIRNYTAMDTFGLERSLGRNLISVADRWISYGVVSEAGAHPDIKAVYASYLHLKRGPDAVVVYAAMPELRRVTGWSDAEVDRALAEIAWEGIRAHPRDFLTARFLRLPLLFRDPSPSSWYALHEETYLPFLARTGRINPELVSRSLTSLGIENASFDFGRQAYETLSLGAASRAWLFFLLLGFAGLVVSERRNLAWLFACMLAFLWLATILMQPPNARYRFPGLPWEMLFTVAGFWFAVRIMIWSIRRVAAFGGRAQAVRLAPVWKWSGKFSDIDIVRLAAGALLVILGARAWAIYNSQPLLRTADLVPRTSSEFTDGSAGDSGASPPPLLRELQVAGRRLTVVYWEGSAMDRDATLSAEAAASGGGYYAARLFYSCEAAQCAGASITLSTLDEEGRTVAQVSSPLSQERVENDLFWDQLELRMAAPSDARRLRLELHLQAGMGNVVVLLVSVRPAPMSW